MLSATASYPPLASRPVTEGNRYATLDLTPALDRAPAPDRVLVLDRPPLPEPAPAPEQASSPGGTPVAGRTRRQALWAWGRLLGGAAILALVLWRVGTGAFLAGLRALDGAALAAAFGIGLLTTVCSAWRWCLVARGLGIRLPLGTAVADYYRSIFLNVALPGGVLGDVHRAVRHGRDVGDVGRGVRAVVLERTAGQLVLITVSVVVLLTHPVVFRAGLDAVTTAPATTVLAVAVAAVAAVGVGIGVAVAGRRRRRDGRRGDAGRWAAGRGDAGGGAAESGQCGTAGRGACGVDRRGTAGRGACGVDRRGAAGRGARWAGVLRATATDVRRGLFARGTWPWIALASAVALAGHLATFVVAARTAGASAPIGLLVPLMLLALLSMTLPLSVGGWGPREGVCAWAFGAAGLSATQGLTVAVVYGVFAFVASLPGAGVLLVQWIAARRPRPDQAAAGHPPVQVVPNRSDRA